MPRYVKMAFGLGLALNLLGLGVTARGTEFSWDNFSGDCRFETRINWDPYPNPPNVPGAGDTAIFDGLLAGSGVGNNVVTVQHGRAIQDMRVIDTAIVDLTIGDGTRSSRFDLYLVPGNSLLVGDSLGDTATFNLRGGWLDTWGTSVGGRAVINVTNPGSYWDATGVVISGDTITNTAGIGLGLSAEIYSRSDLRIGNDTGSGRIAVDGTPSVPFGPAAYWRVGGSVDMGPTGTGGFNFGQLELRSGGRMTVNDDFRVHGSLNAASRATVKTSGQLEVADLLEIGSYGRLELQDANSKIKTGRFSKTGTGGVFDWTAGTLEISNDHLILDPSATDSVFGSSLTVGAEKRLTVSLPDPNNSLEVGRYGNGTLTIEAGGRVESYRGMVGLYGTSNGNVTVRNSGSSWTISEQLRVGQAAAAQGRLEVLNGASVSAGAIFVGIFDDARGEVIVDGLNSSLTTTGPLSVADNGRAQGSLTIQNQGMVSSQAGFINGRVGDSWGTGIATVDGVNSRWLVTQDLVVGNSTGGSGTLTVRNLGTVTVGGNLVVNRFGQVQLATNGRIRSNTLQLAGGTLQGSGTVDVSGGAGLVNAGLVNPGGSAAGSIFVLGDYEQSAAGQLNIQLGGPGSGQFDVLSVTGEADLAGVLTLSVLGGYTPAYGSQFSVLQAGSRVDRFDTMTGTMLSANRWLAPLYEPTGLRLVTALPGDANLDGVVDGSDFGIWNANKFTSGRGWLTGDFNGDGITDGSDFGIWNAHKFTSVASLVAEPVHLWGAMALILVTWIRRVANGRRELTSSG